MLEHSPQILASEHRATTEEDEQVLQEDLSSLTIWEKWCFMSFHPLGKCPALGVGRRRKDRQTSCQLHEHAL